MQLIEQVRRQVESALSPLTPAAAEHARRVAQTKDPALGDYQANVVFALAGELKRPPEQLAAEIAESLRRSELFELVEVAGKGFINLRLARGPIARSLVEAASDGRCGVSAAATPMTYVVDFSSPNVAKPMHVGHIRSTVIGDAITRTLRFLGHAAISDNHLGDWGTQFGMIIYGYKHFLDAAAYERDPVAELSRLYRLVQRLIAAQSAARGTPAMQIRLEELRVAAEAAGAAAAAKPGDKPLEKAARAASRRAEAAAEELADAQAKADSLQSDPQLSALAAKHEDVEAASLAETALLHEGDATNTALWQKFMPHCLAAIHGVFDSLGVSFDHELGESFYHDRLPGVVEALRGRGLARDSEGAVCVFLDGFEAPMIVRKQDGAYLYATTDLATVQYRVEHFDPDAILYVVDHRQSEHFQKLFAAVKLMGYDVDLRHVSFGTVLGNDGKPFKTRSGDVVGLESLLDEAVERARAVVCDPERLRKAALQMDEQEQAQVAATVGLGAIKYADLSHNRTGDYVFDLDKMVQLEGNTAAYVQYSYARTSSILRKAAERDAGFDADAVPELGRVALEHPAERSLALQLLRFEDAVVGSTADFMPHVLTDYLFETSRQFASFFEQCPVLRAEGDAAATRLLLVQLTRQVLRQGLELLGIGVVERM